jgi:G8 domain-containing protein
VRGLSRRGFLILGGAAGAGGIAGGLWYRGRLGDQAPPPGPTTTTLAPRGQPTGAAASSPVRANRWSDPASWSHGVPGPGRTAVVTRSIVLDTDASVGGVAIMPGGRLTFDPRASHELTAAGNVVVRGELVMRPTSAAVTHRLVFTGVREGRFEGGGMDVLEHDVGLWVMDAGRLDLAGSPKLAWTRASGGLGAGATTITLQADPVGWRVGDELVVTPTSPQGEDGGDQDGFETVQVRGLSGRTVTLSRPLRHPHPGVPARPGRTVTAEVLNLTRNVGIEGTADGRAHIFIRSRRPQSLRSAAIRHVGPRQPDGSATTFVPGRYGIHFHMCGNGSRGSLVDGVVVRDAGSHAFVAHLSDGVTFRDCVSHDTLEDAYWWDQAPDTRSASPPSDGIVYDRCVASLVSHDPPERGYRLAGFALGRGRGNVARDCVAVGVRGGIDAAGFLWPEGSEGVWTFEGCTAHNNDQHGIFTWQNTSLVHTIQDFVGYHNAVAGISHGAYQNPYVYRDLSLYGNGYAGVVVHAVSNAEASGPLTFANLTVDGAGRSDYLVVVNRHHPAVPVARATSFTGCSFTGARKAAFGWLYRGQDGPSNLELFEIRGCRFRGNEFWLGGGIVAGSQITVSDPVHGTLVLRRADQPGSLVARWNARVTRL